MFGMVGCILKSVLLPAQERRVAEMDEIERPSPTMFMRNSHVDNTSARSCTTPFAKLRHIHVADLRLGQRHKGCRVEGTVCCKAIRFTAVQVLLEDTKNASHAVKVSLYNLMPASTKLAEVRRLLPEGTRLAVKEPYYKAFLDGTSGIRVDNPADIVFVTDSAQSAASVEDRDFDQIKAQGNQAFR